jgi:hypothetical protein
VFGAANSEPLQIDILTEETVGDFLVYLLVQGTTGPVSTVGFADRERSFTFAFSSQDLAESFLLSARKENLMTQIERVLPMMVSEYFARKKQGWTHSDLCLDPSSAMLSHPNVQLGINLSN